LRKERFQMSTLSCSFSIQSWKAINNGKRRESFR
jgi:hypothetical protein